MKYCSSTFVTSCIFVLSLFALIIHSHPSFFKQLYFGSLQKIKQHISSLHHVECVSNIPNREPGCITNIYPGNVSASRYIAYSDYGRYSNNLIMFKYAVEIAKVTGRKLFVLPLHNTDIADSVFSLSWLQIFDVEKIQSYLDPLGEPCRIRGWNDGSQDPAIVEYILNGTNTDPNINECGIVSHGFDAPLALRRLENWSSNCRLLPWFFIHDLALHRTSNPPAVKIEVYQQYPTGWCRKSHINTPPAVPSKIETADPHVLLSLHGQDLFGHAFSFHTVDGNVSTASATSNLFFDIPYNSRIIELAQNVLNTAHSRGGMKSSPSILCMHIRREDFHVDHPDMLELSDWIAIGTTHLRTKGTTGIIIVTNGDADEIAELKQGLPNAVFGCDAVACRSLAISAAVDQQTCIMSKYFVGSKHSSFSKVIEDKRELHHV
jgi:hypothetical protein